MATFNVNLGEAGLIVKALRRNYADRSKIWTGAAYVAISTLTDAEYLAAMESLTAIETSETATGSYLLTVTDATEREWIEFYNDPSGITDVAFAVQDYEPRTDLNTIDGIVDAILEDTGTTLPAAIGTPAAIDGQAATLAGMATAAYNRVERNAGFDRLAIYGGDKLFEWGTGETLYVTYPCIVYDDDAANWRCYYITYYDGSRCVRMRTSTDGKTNWSDPITVLVRTAGVEANIWTMVVWRESATDWRMLYTVSPTGIYYATSATGLEHASWTKAGLVLAADQPWDLLDDGVTHSREVTDVMKVGSRYYIYNCSINTGASRKIGVAWTDDFVTWTAQDDPIFGEPVNAANSQEPYSGYFSGSVFAYYGYYWMMCVRYGGGRRFSNVELWCSSSPLFPANNRRLVKVIMQPHNDLTFHNRESDVFSVASDDVTKSTFVHADYEFRAYFGALHSTTAAGDGSWYVALATANSAWEAIAAAEPDSERLRQIADDVVEDTALISQAFEEV